MSSKGKSNGATIIIRKEEVVEGGHHGGAWKVAYADFVTAMMAFFLLMWLLNATTEDQRRGLADYFAPAGAMAHQTSGSGAPFGGRTPFDTGSLVSDRGAMTIKAGKATAMVAPDDADAESSAQIAAPRLVDDDGDPASAQLARTPRPDAKGAVGMLGEATGAREGSDAPGAGPGRQQAVADPTEQQEREAAARERARQQRLEQQAFERAANQLRDAVRSDPALAALARQLTIDLTPEGLRIQLLDEDKQPMFATGSSVPNERARLLLQKIAPVLAKLPEPIAITGHTDAQPYRGGERSNWELSSERANVTRRLLLEAGLEDARMRSVAGAADRDLLLPADPLASANRRIAIVVLRRGRVLDTPDGTPVANPAQVPDASAQTGVPAPAEGETSAPAGKAEGASLPRVETLRGAETTRATRDTRPAGSRPSSPSTAPRPAGAPAATAAAAQVVAPAPAQAASAPTVARAAPSSAGAARRPPL